MTLGYEAVARIVFIEIAQLIYVEMCFQRDVNNIVLASAERALNERQELK